MSAPRQLVMVDPAKLAVSGQQLNLDPLQTTYATYLNPCKEIINQHSAIWFSKKPGKVAARLRIASTLIQGLYSSISCMNDPQQLAIHLQVALRNKNYTDIVKSIWCFRGSDAATKAVVRAHRYQLQNNLVTFLEGLKNLYETVMVGRQEIEWFDQTIAQHIAQVQNVDVEEDNLEAEYDVDGNPLVH